MAIIKNIGGAKNECRDSNRRAKKNESYNTPNIGLIFWLTTFSILVLALAWSYHSLFIYADFESTDDAYANGNLININSAVQGSVIAFYADDTDLVQEGQLLISLDPTAYQIKYEEELATLAATVLQVRQLYEAVVTNEANAKSKRIAFRRDSMIIKTARSWLVLLQFPMKIISIPKTPFPLPNMNLSRPKYRAESRSGCGREYSFDRASVDRRAKSPSAGSVL